MERTRRERFQLIQRTTTQRVSSSCSLFRSLPHIGHSIHTQTRTKDHWVVARRANTNLLVKVVVVGAAAVYEHKKIEPQRYIICGN